MLAASLSCPLAANLDAASLAFFFFFCSFGHQGVKNVLLLTREDVNYKIDSDSITHD